MTASVPDFAHLSLSAVAFLFGATAAVIGIAGWKLTGVANAIAIRTGLGQALTGAIFLGAVTSLSGTVTSVSAAANGYPGLAFGNAIGGISVQTAFLAIADITYTRANLEHAAASAANIMQGTLLVVMLGMILTAMSAPEVSVLGMHPVSLALPVVYIFGMRLVSRTHLQPMWRPRYTTETREDAAVNERQYRGTAKLWIRFVVLSALVAVCGWLIAKAGVVLAQRTGLSETAVGAVFTAATTSLPELVTCLAAVRQGALTLAVSDIIGGNVFDTLFVSLSDTAYRDGSLLHAVGPEGFFVTALPVLLTAVLLTGMIQRERSGILNIGFESALGLILYLGGVGVMLSR